MQILPMSCVNRHSFCSPSIVRSLTSLKFFPLHNAGATGCLGAIASQGGFCWDLSSFMTDW